MGTRRNESNTRNAPRILKGVVFDFNGTLYWDTALHDAAWEIMFKRCGVQLSAIERQRLVYGKTNRDILRKVLSVEVPDRLLIYLSDEKESIYRSLCRDTKMSLAPGAIQFLDYLQLHYIPCTIATASTTLNVDFYFEAFALDKWFSRDRVVCDNGNIKSKPDPQIFQLAAESLQIEAKDVLVFEDSWAGITAAERAKVGEIIIVNSGSEDYSHSTRKTITDFAQVPRSLF